ncbi:MAG: GTP cyclohydrolase [Saprospiraceae bacterium]|nr:GTP cyclohydrolase [Saprospiraceae bacterium]
MKIEIKVVNSHTDLKQFVKFPFQLYSDSPFWVPPLIASELAWLDDHENPAFKHSEVVKFTVWREGKMVGRIVGIVNGLETNQLGTAHARFGWFDFINDLSVSKALLDAVEQWAKQHGCTRMKGPYGFNSLDKNGMLVEGFQEMGAMTTLYNYDYYPYHLEQHGFQKELEWLELKTKLPNPMPEKIKKTAGLVLQRFHLTLTRPKHKSEMMELGKVFFKMLKETYHRLPTYVPISEEQQAFYIKNYIGMLPPKFICTVQDEHGETIGFGITMPNLAKAMQKAKGRLFPFGFLHLLLAQRYNDSADLTLIGVKEAWRKRGVHSIIFTELGNTFLKLGYSYFNVNPMLEGNQNVLTLWNEFEYRIHKRRRTYFKEI